MNPPRRGKAGGQDRPKDVLDIAAVLLFYGADRVPSGAGWRKMKCIHGERNPSATVNIEEGAFKCFSCGLAGDTIAIIRKMDECSYMDACKKYKEITGVDISGVKTSSYQGTATAVESKSYESGSWLASRLRKG